jgi:prolyl-tRNA synthetase
VPVRLFEQGDFEARGLVKGYVGPQGLPPDALIVADPSVRARHDWVTGANRLDHHVTGANPGRDFRVDRWEDVARVIEGDPCPRCGAPLHVSRGIVVGHIYQLVTRYSKALEATFVDEDGSERHFEMGCYGIGLSRIVAAAAEQFHDDAGLKWPRALAPFDAAVIPTNMDQPDVVEAGERAYAELRAAGLDVVIDDREATAGVKFADADLIGYPLQVVVGARGLRAGNLELKVRATGERTPVSLDAVAASVGEAWAVVP